ncbi:MAG: DUF167 domain-containing protein [Enhydrobacter sp.]|nr:DUF167 domain-containing protein [Enhydrobacter sp.]
MIDPSFLRRGAAGVTVELRVQPRARRTSLESAGDTLKATVTAPPEDGRANTAVIALLAETWRLPRSSFGIVKGASSRMKTVSVAGEPGALADRIVQWMNTHV